MGDIICSYMFLENPHAGQFYFSVPHIGWVWNWEVGIFDLWKAETYLMGDGEKRKFRHENSPWLGMHGNVARAEPAMCQPRAKCADWGIWRNLGKLGYYANYPAR